MVRLAGIASNLGSPSRTEALRNREPQTTTNHLPPPLPTPIHRYSYDPFQHSPNEAPESELRLNAGDYVLVWGEVDEDGFLDGETLDGRRGLVPSNFVQKLVGEDLLEFHRQVVAGLRDCDQTSISTSVPHDLDFNSADEALLNNMGQ